MASLAIKMIEYMVDSYSMFMGEHAVAAQMMTAGVMVTFGDILAQTFVSKNSRFSKKRCFIMAMLGCFYFGPCIGLWLILLDNIELEAIFKVLMDQIIFSPLFLSGFFLFETLLMGKPFEQWKRKMKFELIGVMKKSAMLWIPVQFVNFKFVPFQFRMIVIQTVSLFWNTFLSYKANSSPSSSSESIA